MSTEKRQVEGLVVKLLHHKRTDRGMMLASFETRCVQRGEIHELVSTDHAGTNPGDRIDRVGFLCFLEITRAGVIEIGDSFCHHGETLGRVIGFDESHFPNHYNILIGSETLLNAGDAALSVEDTITFQS
jgi:hypothetical protein